MCPFCRVNSWEFPGKEVGRYHEDLPRTSLYPREKELLWRWCVIVSIMHCKTSPNIRQFLTSLKKTMCTLEVDSAFLQQLRQKMKPSNASWTPSSFARGCRYLLCPQHFAGVSSLQTSLLLSRVQTNQEALRPLEIMSLWPCTLLDVSAGPCICLC